MDIFFDKVINNWAERTWAEVGSALSTRKSGLRKVRSNFPPGPSRVHRRWRISFRKGRGPLLQQRAKSLYIHRLRYPPTVNSKLFLLIRSYPAERSLPRFCNILREFLQIYREETFNSPPCFDRWCSFATGIVLMEIILDHEVWLFLIKSWIIN